LYNGEKCQETEDEDVQAINQSGCVQNAHEEETTDRRIGGQSEVKGQTVGCTKDIGGISIGPKCSCWQRGGAIGCISQGPTQDADSSGGASSASGLASPNRTEAAADNPDSIEEGGLAYRYKGHEVIAAQARLIVESATSPLMQTMWWWLTGTTVASASAVRSMRQARLPHCSRTCRHS
jgi:hypothetical protein